MGAHPRARRASFVATIAAVAGLALTVAVVVPRTHHPGADAAGGDDEAQPSVAPPSTAPAPTAASPTTPPAAALREQVVLAWTPGGLPEGFAEAAQEVAGVDHVVAVTSGTAWLRRSLDPAGSVFEQPPDGLAVPLEVAGVEPQGYARVLRDGPPQLRDALAAGQAVVGSSAAVIRGVGAGSSLVFDHAQVRVAAVVPDEAIGWHEAMFDGATATSLGVDVPRYLLILPEPGADLTSIREGLVSIETGGKPLRIRLPGETPYLRHADAVLPAVEMKRLMGEFAASPRQDGTLAQDPAWVRDTIVEAEVPILGRVRCNRHLLPQLRGALAEVVERGLSHLVDPADYGGCHFARFIGWDPAAPISRHAWGAAIDINVSTNRLGDPPRMDPRVVEIFERWGFVWGGRWSRPDPMHFELGRLLSP